MSETPSHDDIVTALKQSGYLMEQEVATQLERLDFHVRTNRAYQDADALSDLLAEQIEDMPPQLKAAARFVCCLIPKTLH